MSVQVRPSAIFSQPGVTPEYRGCIMARPPADYIPVELYEQAAAMGMSAKEYSEAIFDQTNRIYSIFRGNHNKIRPFCRLADIGGIDLDALVEKIENREMRAWLDALINRPIRVDGVIYPPLGNLNQLCKQIAVSRTWIGSLYDDKCELKALKTYVDAARRLGWSMAQMRNRCKI